MDFKIVSWALLLLSAVTFLGGVYSGTVGYLFGFEPETYWRAAVLLALWAIGIRLLTAEPRG